MDICEECRLKYLTAGVALVNPETGSVIVLRDEVFQAIFDHPVPEDKIAYAEEHVLDQIAAVYKAVHESESPARQGAQGLLN